MTKGEKAVTEVSAVPTGLGSLFLEVSQDLRPFGRLRASSGLTYTAPSGLELSTEECSALPLESLVDCTDVLQKILSGHRCTRECRGPSLRRAIPRGFVQDDSWGKGGDGSLCRPFSDSPQLAKSLQCCRYRSGLFDVYIEAGKNGRWRRV